MYIKKLTLTQFRNIEGTLEIQFLETQVVVLGANGAGKSNIPLAVGFVLNCDGKFLNIKHDVDLINQAHQRENEMASCSVELLLEDETSDNKGNPMTVKTILKRTLDVQSRSVYMIDGIINTKEQYDATVRAINLRPRAVLIPQRALTDFESSSNYGYGKCIESLFRDLADREFSSDDEKQLIKDKANASNLKKRIAVCKNMIDNLRRSQGNNAAPTPDLELEIGKCERLLILAALWRIDTRIQQGKNSLGELRKAVEELESYQVVTGEKIERTQVKMQKVIKELDAYDEAEVGRKDLEEKALSKQNVLQGLEASRSRLQEIINRVQNSTSGSPGSNTEASEELLRQMEELEVSSSLGAFLYDKMEEFNERFEAEHPEDFNAMMTLREADRSQYSHRRDIQNQLRIEGRKRFLAREEKRVTMESIESFDEKIFRMETKISVYRSFMKNNESDMEAIEKLILKKQNRLKHLQKFRCATRREPRHRNEFALRCLIEGAGEYFADEFPARAIYGLLQDLIEPRREIDRISIERALSEYLDSIVVKDRYVQGRMKALMGGDGEYKAPRTKILVLPRAGKSRRGLTRQREGIPLVHTFRVSDLFNGDRITAARILRLFNDLARNILYCQDYSQSLTFIKRCQRLKQEDEAPVEALSADGVMISRSAAMKLFPQFPEMELPFPDDLRSMADIEKEIQGLEAFLRRQPGVGFVLYKSLQFGIELSVRKLERELALIKKQREAAVSKLSSLDPFIQNCDEVYRTVESNLMLLRSGPEAVARRRERLRINTIRMGYMSADADAPRGFSEAEITAALEHDQLENILEQDYILSKLIEASEDGVREQWRSRMDGMLETLGQVRVAEVSREQQTAHKDLESARKSLLERRDFLQATMSDKQTKMEKRERLNAELSKLRCGMRTLIRETERFKIKVQHNILHLKNLRRRRQELLLKRDIMDPDANSNDTYEMELDVNIDEGKLVRAPPAIDYTDIPTSAKESEETINNFIKSTKNTLKALRLEKLDKIVMTRNAAQIDDPDSKKKLEEKTATLKTCEEDLKRLETRIKTFDESKRRYNEILNSYVPRVLQEVPRIYEKLTGLKIKVKTEKSASNGYKDAKISFYGSSEKFQSFDFECITGGEKAILLLSIVLAIQMTEETPFLILDEIDARVNDRSCLNLNRAISRYATSRQVICISHKPEIMRDVNVQLIGMIRCPIKRNVIALSYDPRADYTDNFNEHACKFRGCLTSEEVEFILTENPRSEFP